MAGVYKYIECVCRIKKKLYDQNYFTIACATLVKLRKGVIIFSDRRDGEFIIKGDKIKITENKEYFIKAKEVVSEKYGIQYEIVFISDVEPINPENTKAKRMYLSSLFTDKQVEEMYKTLYDPYQIFLEKKIDELVKVKGIGQKTASRMVEVFERNRKYTNLYLELQEFGLTQKMMDKLLYEYKSDEMVIDVIKTNPYRLLEVEGIGWNTADSLAIDGGIDVLGIERTTAFIEQYLAACGQTGFTWVSPDELLGAIIEFMGEEISDATISKALHNLYDSGKIYWDKDKTKIANRYYYNLEYKIAQELIRIRDAKNNFKYDNWKEVVSHLEHKQGWQYTPEQISGIYSVLQNNVCVIHGLSGTGKTTIVSAMLAVLKDYSFVQCALSGRAGARMQEVTGVEGKTIHRLLKKAGHGYIERTKEKPLDEDIVIIDEISMVDSELFYELLCAIKTGSKLIMLGDMGQLESIGAGNIAHDMINSPEIPTTYLSKIQRQAQDSGIISESYNIRTGKQIVPKNWVGEETRGVLKDFNITCYSDKNNTITHMLAKFSQAIVNSFDIMEIQMLGIKRSTIYNLNIAAQELYNPAQPNKNEVVTDTNNGPYIFRVGDKVINTVNNYNAINEQGDIAPVYNGNIGLIEEIVIFDDDDDDECEEENKHEEYMLINFWGIGRIKFFPNNYENLELAYAITVHKSQGSEFNYIILGIDYSGYTLLTREIVYTGITRAKKQCDLIAQTAALRYATMQEGVSRKQTFLEEFLDEIAHPTFIF